MIPSTTLSTVMNFFQEKMISLKNLIYKLLFLSYLSFFSAKSVIKTFLELGQLYNLGTGLSTGSM